MGLLGLFFDMIYFFGPSRYAINNNSADWSAAEGQVARLKHRSGATVVSVKSTPGGTKRKADEAGEGQNVHKKPTRRGKTVKR